MKCVIYYLGLRAYALSYALEAVQQYLMIRRLLMLEPQSPRENHLLRALPISEWARVTPHLELVPLPLGEVVYESGNELHHVHFPATGAIVSLLYVMTDVASPE